MTQRVVIAGAGLGGLSCAYELHKAGLEVTVLESRSEVGGRTRSARNIFEGQILELGAEYVGSNHPLWNHYARLFGIKLEKVSSDTNCWVRFAGESFSGKGLERLQKEQDSLQQQISGLAEVVDCEFPWKTKDAAILDDTSLEDGVRSLEGSESAKERLLFNFHLNEAAHPAKVSWLGILAIISGHGSESYWRDTEAYRCPEGVQQLAQSLRSQLPDSSLKFCTSLKEVSSGSDSIEAVSTCGQTFAADWFVLAIPPSQWRKISFRGIPELPSIPLGPASKEFVHITRRFWYPDPPPEATSDVSGGYLSEVAVNGSADQPGCLSFFVAGDYADAIDEIDSSKRQIRLKNMISERFPAISGNWLNWHGHDWKHEEGIEGAYSYSQPGRITRWGKLLSSGCGRLRFAGEYASFKYAGYMEGALETGVRSAKQILSTSVAGNTE